MAEKRKTYDWEAIEADYRSGQLSLRQLSELYGPSPSTIQYRVKKDGWERDLSDKVRKQTDAVLNRDAVEDSQADENDIIKAAGQRAAGVVLNHRKGINRLHNIFDRLAGVTEKELEKYESRKPAAVDSKDLQRLQNGFGHCCRSYAQIVLLERQAFGLDPRGAEGAEQEKDKGPVKFIMNFGGKK